MSWAVGWDYDHDRFRGYGVPAYCDAAGCDIEIDRGLGWLCDCLDCRDEDPMIFVCGEHSHDDVDEDNLPPEHPEWVNHLLTDESWAKWRDANPARVAALRGAR